MSENFYEIKLQEAEKFYFSIGNIPCPALDDEIVYFEWTGFRHLIRKGRKARKIEDQLRRFKLLESTPIVIRAGRKILDAETRQTPDSLVKFIALSLNIKGVDIKIVLQRFDNGKLYFLSIMN